MGDTGPVLGIVCLGTLAACVLFVDSTMCVVFLFSSMSLLAWMGMMLVVLNR